MLDKNLIKARLEKGEDIADIANELTVLINEANKEYSEEKKANSEKVSSLQDILDDLKDWLITYYPEQKGSAEAVFAAFDAKRFIAEVEKPIKVFKTSADVADKVLGDWLSRMGF